MSADKHYEKVFRETEKLIAKSLNSMLVPFKPKCEETNIYCIIQMLCSIENRAVTVEKAILNVAQEMEKR